MNSKERSLRFVIMTFSSFIIMLAPTTIFLANASYAQLPEPSSTPALPDDAVAITSPQDGQRVPMGQDLEVTGTSMANAASDW